jgi:hypothetical protein
MPDVFISPPQTAPLASSNPSPLPQPSSKHSLPPNGTAISLLTAFCEKPLGVTFANQHTHEVILLFLRRHLITNVPWIFFTIVLLLIPSLFAILLQMTSFPLSFLPDNYMFILMIFYYLIVFAFALTNFMSWFYNISLVTTERVVDIDFSEIVYHDVASTKLPEIEEVHYKQIGFIRSFFNYGDIHVHTASDTENFDFLKVPSPQKGAEIIGRLLGEKKGDTDD